MRKRIIISVLFITLLMSNIGVANAANFEESIENSDNIILPECNINSIKKIIYIRYKNGKEIERDKICLYRIGHMIKEINIRDENNVINKNNGYKGQLEMYKNINIEANKIGQCHMEIEYEDGVKQDIEIEVRKYEEKDVTLYDFNETGEKTSVIIEMNKEDILKDNKGNKLVKISNNEGIKVNTGNKKVVVQANTKKEQNSDIKVIFKSGIKIYHVKVVPVKEKDINLGNVITVINNNEKVKLKLIQGSSINIKDVNESNKYEYKGVSIGKSIVKVECTDKAGNKKDEYIRISVNKKKEKIENENKNQNNKEEKISIPENKRKEKIENQNNKEEKISIPENYIDAGIICGYIPPQLVKYGDIHPYAFSTPQYSGGNSGYKDKYTQSINVYPYWIHPSMTNQIKYSINLGSEAKKSINIDNIANTEYANGVGLSAHAYKVFYENWTYSFGEYKYGKTDCAGMIRLYAPGLWNIDMFACARAAHPEGGKAWGYIGNMPRVHGLALYSPGHVGVYVGSGMSIDLQWTNVNSVYAPVYYRDWGCWYKISGCQYPVEGFIRLNNNVFYYENEQYLVNTTKEINGVEYKFNSLGYADKEPDEEEYNKTTWVTY